MVQSQRAQQESYQRVQALLLVQDMVARIGTNRTAADCYVQATPLGTGNAAVPDASACVAVGTTAAQLNRATQDLKDWKDLLLGSAERLRRQQRGRHPVRARLRDQGRHHGRVPGRRGLAGCADRRRAAGGHRLRHRIVWR